MHVAPEIRALRALVGTEVFWINARMMLPVTNPIDILLFTSCQGLLAHTC